tara:strand:+ start:23 stop:190 length:168 start_codon:yes stop_codon:yes gene_type:complete
MSILSSIVKRQVKKNGGLIGLLLLVGDMAVKSTRSSVDDQIWEKVKKILLKEQKK